MKYFYLILLLFVAFHSNAQNTNTQFLKGKVVNKTSGEKAALTGANVYWLSTKEGTTTDIDGNFTIKYSPDLKFLVVSFIGFKPDTIEVKSNASINIALSPSIELNTITIESKTESKKVSLLDPINIQSIGQNELAKAACCNLSESFETNPSVDASFSDAVTGTKQIKMLGLSGNYTQIMLENLPGIRGLAVLRGLNYIPGPWVSGIQISKGAGSVVNGFESITGQINLEIKKPEGEDKLHLNGYAGLGGRTELAAIGAKKLNSKWYSSLLLHTSNRFNEIDNNNDGFLDLPKDRTFNVINRWKYFGTNGWVAQIGVRGTYDKKLGGQKGFREDERKAPFSFAGVMNDAKYGVKIESKLLNSWAKFGKVSQTKENTSFGIQVSGTIYDENSFFGLKDYLGTQKNLYVNGIYQSYIGSSKHLFKTGISNTIDNYSERIGHFQSTLTTFDRTEVIPGAFFEYTFSGSEKINLIAGLRGDYHSIFGFFVSPRAHLRYSPAESTSLKLAVGKGYRSANIYAENSGLLLTGGSFNTIFNTSSFPVSQFNYTSSYDSSHPYKGANQEVAWNFGLNLTHKFELDYRPGSIVVDFYHTKFEQQVVIDQYVSPGDVFIYNLSGQSYSNSFLTEINYEVLKRLDLRVAYKWNEVYTNYLKGIHLNPFIPKHRGFVNLEYKTRKGAKFQQWKFDITGQWIGEQIVPFTLANKVEGQLYGYSESYFTINTQITRVFSNKFDIYIGSENITDYKQNTPIQNANAPFDQKFDASKIWAPIFGRMIYIGLNYKIKS